MELWQLKQRQSLPLEAKIIHSQNVIRQWYEYWDGQVYVSFSGGKDSTVLLHLVRELYPGVPAVFVDTGLEYPEIKDFVKTFDNVIWVKPKMRFDQVIAKYGYPVSTKEQASYIYEVRTTKSDKLRNMRLNGVNGSWGISNKWKSLLDAPFLVSDKCCDVIKKQPSMDFEKKNNLKPFVGTLASEGRLRMVKYLRQGCNAFNAKRPTSTPLSIWNEEDVWDYIRDYKKIPYSKIYDMGEKQTGCMFCMFGVHLEKEPNRFQMMRFTHPKQYEYCINKLGLGQVLDYIGVKY